MRRKSEKVFSFTEFAKIAARDEEDFADFGCVITQGHGQGNTYTFKDNGSSILGVAHVDTVQYGAHSSLIRVNGERVLLCPRLDDRLGVYIITRLLPRMGITCDWLLTTGEETGNSSAEIFTPEKEYHWAFSFDRSGADCVLYQFEHKALCRVLRKAGFKIGQGSFSDLSAIDLGCSGVNFGCGYYNPHSEHAYALLSETFAMVDLFADFYREHSKGRLPFDPKSRSYTMTSWERSRERAYAFHHYGRSGFHGYNSNYGYPDGYNEGIWDSNGKYLSWYEVEDQLDGLSQEERLEILADNAQRDGERDNGR